MNILVSASIGLYKDKHDQKYIQIITAENQSNIILPISDDTCDLLSGEDNIEVAELPKLAYIHN